MECKSFFYANYFNNIDPWQVLSYLICMPLFNHADHAIWQKSLSTSIVLTVFPWVLEVNASKKEKKASLSIFVLDSKTKGNKIVLQKVGFEISREQQGLLLQSRKMAKRWQRSWKTHWNYRGIEFHELFSKRSKRSKLFRRRSGQANGTRDPAPYKNWTKDCFENLL